MDLTGQQWQQFTEALVDAFPSYPRLSQMVQFRLERNLAAISGDSSLTNVAFTLIQQLKAEGQLTKLIQAARESNPSNPKLLAFAQQFELGPTTPPRTELEKIIKQGNRFLDIHKWRERLGQIEVQVCRVEVNRNDGFVEYGTGFLLGPSVVMTNYHVMQSVIEKKQAAAKDVILRFDYKRIQNGTILNPGKEYHLTNDEWLIDSSPPSPVDWEEDPKSGVPSPNELDFVLLRVDGIPGDATVGEKDEPGAPTRGWITPRMEEYTFAPATPLCIVQHPRHQPLKLAIDMESIIGLNTNGTRIQYKTNTEPGSSGSPCFTIDWELVGIHHSGGPDYLPKYNEGIPMNLILKRLEKKGLLHELGRQEL